MQWFTSLWVELNWCKECGNVTPGFKEVWRLHGSFQIQWNSWDGKWEINARWILTTASSEPTLLLLPDWRSILWYKTSGILLQEYKTLNNSNRYLNCHDLLYYLCLVKSAMFVCLPSSRPISADLLVWRIEILSCF